jgi:hypothetical protein
MLLTYTTHLLCMLSICCWLRGTVFSQLPSAVTSTVDHPSGSPSLCCGLPSRATHRSILYPYIYAGLPLLHHARHSQYIYIYIHMLWHALSYTLSLRIIAYTVWRWGQTAPSCTTSLTIYVYIYPSVVVAWPHLQPVALYYIMSGVYRPDSSAPSYTPLLTLCPMYIHIGCGMPYLRTRCSILYRIVVVDARLPPRTPRRSHYILRISIYAVACPISQPVVCITSFTGCRHWTAAAYGL